MTDVFGNYVIQKFFEFGTPEQKSTLAQKVFHRRYSFNLLRKIYSMMIIFACQLICNKQN